MEREFVPYELAVKLNELGFNAPVLSWDNGHGDMRYENNYNYRNYTPIPLWGQAFDFFRLEMGIDSWIQKTYDCYNINIVRMDDDFEGNEDLTDGLSFKDFRIYEQARQQCLEKLIDIVKNDNINIQK